MIDPMISLAFAVYTNKGVYALLLGSGLSRASGIPTGWEILLDLIRKLAMLKKDNCEPDPEAWFREEYNSEPNYSSLLDVIAKTTTERQQLLRGYFEPTEDERDQGVKVPSAAHRAIAKLVAAGYLRVIITTNFDRLMERALEEAGVALTVISTTDQLAGVLPLAHSGATVIKLHGDYTDTRIKNTEEELATYDEILDRLLDRVFDEYGLIVSGWSGDWDTALRVAIERCPTRRFTTFWTIKSPLSERVKRLAEYRQSALLRIKDADHMFEELWEKVQTLKEMDAPHPLSAKMAVATVKRYLIDPSARIRLHDLVHDETEKLIAELSDPKFAAETQLQAAEEVTKRVERYGILSEILLSVIVTSAYWGNEDATNLLVNSLQRAANPVEIGGLTYLLKLRRYPALLLLYGAGISAVAANNYQTLATILIKPRAKNTEGKNEAICCQIYPHNVMVKDIASLLPNLENHHTPLNDHIYDELRGPLRDFLPRDEDYQNSFDRFEYLLGLVHVDLTRQNLTGGGWRGPVGCFAWRNSEFDQEDGMAHKFEIELEAEGPNWGPLKAGLFGGSAKQAKEAITQFNAFVRQIRF